MSALLQGPRAPRVECYVCFKPQVACVCATIERVDNRTGLTILQHPRERLHPLGTARIARLGFTRVRVESFSQWAGVERGAELNLPPQTALLYPSATSREICEVPPHERPQHLVVIDGTWFHARKIFAAQQWLQRLPHVHITPQRPSAYGNTRAEPAAHCVATLEAIIYALHALEPDTRGLDGLLASFAAMVARQAAFTPSPLT